METKDILFSTQCKQKLYIDFFKNETEIEKYCMKFMPIDCLKSKL